MTLDVPVLFFFFALGCTRVELPIDTGEPADSTADTDTMDTADTVDTADDCPGMYMAPYEQTISGTATDVEFKLVGCATGIVCEDVETRDARWTWLNCPAEVRGITYIVGQIERTSESGGVIEPWLTFAEGEGAAYARVTFK